MLDPDARDRLRWRTPQWALALALAAAPACDGGDGGGGDEVSDSTTDGDTEGNAAWIEVGWGQNSFLPLVDGDDFEIVWGTQGSAMFPILLRGGNFALPDEPSNWQDPAAPIVELWLDIEGHNDGFGGHFKRIANYQAGFTILEDGTYESTYIAILIPDGKVPDELAGLPATLWLSIDPIDTEPVEVELALNVVVGAAPR